MYETGLIVGKFCPLHKGHQYLIDTALEQCRKLIIISYAKPEYDNCSVQNRRDWLAHLYPNVTRLIVDDTWLRSQASKEWTDIPHDNAADEIHRKFTAWLCFDYLKQTPNAVFTSETYGDGFAKFMGRYISTKLSKPHTVKHVCVDEARKKIPISGTKIRKSPFLHRHHLDKFVYRSFVKRAVILGGESTGKTTLCAALAERLQTKWCPEYGRTLWDHRNGNLAFEDMLKIANQQISDEEALTRQSDKWLICDTSPLTTTFYSQAMFNEVASELTELADRPYDVTLLCDDDFDFVQDGTRRDETFRKNQQAWYRKELERRNIPYTLLSGPIERRLETALKTLNEASATKP